MTSSHELSARLDGPRRALTAALNARLIGTIARLNTAVEQVLETHNIRTPIMVVRGDGSLVSAAFAGRRPIETVLSGPAASVIGALHLAGTEDGLVVDIGGTTTDVAVIRGGRPSLAEGGAIVGGYRTMVEAVDMATAGLGGDSEVRIVSRERSGPVVLGPERAIPICRLALEYPELHKALDVQLAAPMGNGDHGRFYLSTIGEAPIADEREQKILDQLIDGPKPVGSVASSGLAAQAALRLRARGQIRVATMTPTDAAAVLGTIDDVDGEAARKVASLLARQSRSNGAPVAVDAETFSQMVLDKLVRASADFSVRTALADDGVSLTRGDSSLIDAALDRAGNVAAITVGLSNAVTAIGAPAGAYYGAVGGLLGVDAVIPEHAEVANAVGAVVGRVVVRRSATITQPTKGQFRVHLDEQPTFGSVENARAHAEELLMAAALADADAAGASTPELTSDWDAASATVEGKDVFVEGTLTVEASGRPRL